MAAAMAAGTGGSVAGVGRDGRVGGSCLCKTSGTQNTQGPRTGEDSYFVFPFNWIKVGILVYMIYGNCLQTPLYHSLSP